MSENTFGKIHIDKLIDHLRESADDRGLLNIKYRLVSREIKLLPMDKMLQVNSWEDYVAIAIEVLLSPDEEFEKNFRRRK